MSIEQNIENLEIRNANVVTFVGSSSTIVDTISGRIQCKGFQHNSNVITDISGPHGRVAPTLKKYPEIIFADGKFDRNDTTNTYVQAGYTVTASGVYQSYHPWFVFGDIKPNNGYVWHTPTDYTNSGVYVGSIRLASNTDYGHWIKLETLNKIKLSNIRIFARYGIESQAPKNFQICGSINNVDWDIISDVNNASPSDDGTNYTVTTNNFYNYFAIVVNEVVSSSETSVTIQNIQFYGYEEYTPAGDHSVDTTFKSRFNNPQLTGVQVFVDGKGSGSNQISGGPDVTGTTTYNESGKHWELNGQLTSNITMEANTFLEGDQPHAVSVWFNSSNLEANVSNTCVFSVSDQEKLDSQNLDLQSNTWHNLTYAYQGEGGSRVTYLDGRKVAEDQAEDTFGAYPPFAMTGYSQGGYVVSGSDTGTADHSTGNYLIYDNDSSTIKTHGSHYNNSGLYNRSPPTNHGGNVLSGDAIPNGEWHKIQMPHKLILGSIGIRPRNSSYAGEPVNWYLYGSNDDVDWTMLYKKTDSVVPSDDYETQYTVNAASGLSYFLLIMTKSAGYGTVNICELNWYGHRENDLVRLPDPTNVLKYPHVVMTGPAQRGYVAKVSSQTSTTADYPHIIFDGDDTTQFRSALNTYTSGTANTTDNLKTQTSAGGTATIDGSWISIELPHKLILQSTRVVSSDGTSHVPKRLIIYGSNDITNDGWVEVDTTYKSVDANIPYQGTGKTWTTTASSTGYKNFALAVSQIESTGNNRLVVSTWELYGTGVDSIPIQIGGGNIDKVANFRVYDKFVGEDQALEIWDAQKDEFGRAKPQMVLQQGKLGIGTDAPQGSLSVADEPDPTTYGLQEFPPKPLDAYKTLIEGHGEFCVSASSYLAPETGGSSGYYYPYNVFDEAGTSTISNMSWISMNSGSSHPLRYTVGTGLPNANAASTGGISGEWVQLKLPYKIKLSYLRLMGQAGYTERAPVDGVLVGSTDGVTWTTVSSWSGASYTDLQYNTFTANVDSTNYYNYLRLIVTRVSGVANHLMAAIQELKFFGIREQVTKQSVLHDGQLTLTKSLTVPRIGPALDADDTPRRDRLVVEYNTSTNPTFEGAVRDTSGRGLDGVFVGTATYNTNEKVFDGFSNTKYIRTDLTVLRGNIPHSHSVWIKLTSDNNNWNTAINLGQNNGNGNQSAVTWDTGNNRLWLNTYNGGVYAQIAPDMNKWYHVVATHDGSGAPSITTMKIYINGNQWPIYDTTGNGGGGTINIAGDYLTIGAGESSTGAIQNVFGGDISTYKLYDCVLTAEEARTLYSMGQCDEGHHMVNFSKTRVGIGLGDGEAPTYTLDVRGQIRSQGSLVTSFTGQHICSADEPMEKGLIVSAKKNRFVKLNGFATGREAITVDESLPIVSLSNVAQDKACFGVVSSIEKPSSKRKQEIGGVISESIKIAGDNRAIVNSVGEGAIWVVNTGGSLESGDYITTSNVAGYGQKQDGAGLMNYTVAKITMDCDFTASNVAVQTIKREDTGLQTIMEDTWNQLVDYDRSSNTETQYSNTLVSSDYSGQSGYTPREVTTIMDYTDGSNLISTAEWSNLESNIQNTYQSNTFTEIVDYTKFVNLSEWSNLTTETQATYSEAEITTYYQIQRGGNVLDENGQLQFEDKTGATEAPYEKRFLTVDGTQTDEANAVHIAAFVGCTYHCG
ncbi:hypothetical protein MPVG_00155 [Micromonas pusilla virus 12T]|uniref:hypothetical protein n=1 Tax=Micromonas pusilla virus 12T TaxID=755272 RepID=UPI0002C10431|nr:hypothetical protein MPVG_00155 [Micromonas pusilla virus 12T]AGH30975.1 hypothetical protein MPVG_00155 [Micromonas pusilla virus 12T]